MPFRSALHPIIREAVAALFSALLLLSALAGARLDGVKAADTARLGNVALCLPSGEDGGNADPDHDCGQCCLPSPLAHRVAAFAVPFVFVAGAGTTQHATGRSTPTPLVPLPWSRGPPA